MRAVVLLPCVLAACAQTQAAVDDIARRSAKAAVAETLTTRLPFVPQASVTPFTDCIIDNASAREIARFAQDAVTGVDDQTVALTQEVLARPATTQCIASTALAA
ncbi:MAG: hypothetical protein AAF218_00765 [Pseudomonadota bacterium]